MRTGLTDEYNDGIKWIETSLDFNRELNDHLPLFEVRRLDGCCPLLIFQKKRRQFVFWAVSWVPMRSTQILFWSPKQKVCEKENVPIVFVWYLWCQKSETPFFTPFQLLQALFLTQRLCGDQSKDQDLKLYLPSLQRCKWSLFICLRSLGTWSAINFFLSFFLLLIQC